MFGYVRPSPQRLNEEEQNRFSSAYCGLCHTLQRRYGLFARMILNYDLTFLAILLSDGQSCCSCQKRCIAHPIKKRSCAAPSPALNTAADMSVILSWWQLQDGISDHGFWGGLKYRIGSLFLRGAYRKARTAQPEFDEKTKIQLQLLDELEKSRCDSIDQPADTFARLLAGAAAAADDPVRRRILEQMFYHLGRWVYLADAADDLKKDLESGNYNPLALRFAHHDGILTEESKKELAGTMDRSVEQLAAAIELADVGGWTTIIHSVVYEGMYAVGRAVLDGTFHHNRKANKSNPTRKAGANT